MEFITILTIGIVEGLTEYIPVSSTAHLLIVGKLLNIPSGTFLEAISICIQSGAIIAAVWYFRKTIWYNKHLWGKITVAFIPTAVAGVALYPFIKRLFESATIIAIALIVVGILLIVIKPNDSDESVAAISYKQAFLIGCIQIVSFIPGISRAGATLVGGSFAGISRTIIVPFSFLLAIPTIFGASVVEIRNVEGLTTQQWYLIGIAALVAFLTALATMRFFIAVLTKKPLSWFGWYRIVVGIFVLLFLT